MTDRPAGTPEPDPTDADALEPAAAPEDGGDGIDLAAEAADDTAEIGAGDGTVDDEALDAATDGDEALDDDVDGEDLEPDEGEAEAEPDDYDLAVREVAGEKVATPAAAAGAAAAAARAKRRAQPAPSRAPSPSEIAVHVREDWSKAFVILTVVVFTAILLNALLLGHGGLLAAKPSASPNERQGRRRVSRRHRRSRQAHVRARLRRVERREHQHSP